MLNEIKKQHSPSSLPVNLLSEHFTRAEIECVPCTSCNTQAGDSCHVWKNGMPCKTRVQRAQQALRGNAISSAGF